uniref:Triokinase/FMN cyclase n=2 Tax=Hirondellea gigas TaxID=1518452 RepID=A0A2P2ID09_9CRUS
MSQSTPFINSAESCVDEQLLGFTAVNTAIVKLKDYRVVVDSARFSADADVKCVSIVTGGGSGHEPFAAGYVGTGMLASAVAGSVFASPPTPAIVAAISAAAGRSSGVLVVVMNYTGDKLNFGQAVEKCRAMGMKVEMYISGDDSALTEVEHTAGRRGLCGTLFLLKIVGAQACGGASMKELLKSCELVGGRCSTIGVAASGCTVPGHKEPLFSVKKGWLELGLGIHGEAGVRLVQSKTAKELVNLMLDHLSNKDSVSNVPLERGDELVVMLNNLGAMTQIEMFTLVGETNKALVERGFVVQRLYVGCLLTSLDMKGFHISLLKTTGYPEWLKLLDTPTNAPGWPAPYRADVDSVDVGKLMNFKNPFDDIKKMSTYTVSVALADQLRKFLEILVKATAEWRDLLNDLDTGCGDGDCGTTIAEGASKISSSLDTLAYHQPVLLFQQLADIAGEAMGGTSGALYSILLSVMSNSLASSVGDSTGNIKESWVKCFIDAVDSVSKYGGAQRGDRTMLDALYPASDAAKKASNSSSLSEVLKDMSAAALDGAGATVSMTARAGRASYVRGGDVRKVDAGARAVAFILKSLADTAASSNI